MRLHQTTGRWKLGLALSLVTCLLWGVLPVALKALLAEMDVLTITWYRFAAAALLLLVFLARRGGLPSRRQCRGEALVLLVVASLALCSNYILYLSGLDRLSPSAATVVIQLAPIFLLLGGLIIFRERFTVRQWLGLALVIGGMALFFNHRLAELLRHLTAETIGVLLVVASGVAWATYGLAQKQLLRGLSSPAIMFVIYMVGTVVFLPLARPAHILELSGMHLVLLAFCALNTLLAYGAFAEALDHWEASRVSAVLATIPIMTMLAMHVVSSHWPALAQPENLGGWSIVGALVVVAGSMLTALSDNPQRRLPPRETPAGLADRPR